jgi:hypothetical protein
MGWSFRKSKSVGPFRFTFSNRGLSMSTGVKGARIRFNGRGTYVTLGVGGIYYNQRIGGKRRAAANSFSVADLNDRLVKQAEFGARVRDAEDDAAMNRLTDSTSQAFVEELESKPYQFAFFKPALIVGLIALLCYFGYAFERLVVSEDFKTVFVVDKRKVHIRERPDKNSRSLAMTYQGVRLQVIDTAFHDWIKVVCQHGADSTGFIHASMGTLDRAWAQNHYQLRAERQPMLKVAGAGLLVAWVALLVWLRRLDERRKMMFINYTMDDGLRQLYDKFMECFQEFASTARIWHTVGTRQSVTRNLIQDISPHRLPSPHLDINVSVPYIRLPDKELYFFPERIIFRRGRQFGAVFYKHIQIKRTDVRVRESDDVPTDATVVDQAKDKRQRPICQYTEYTFTSVQGWTDTIMTSRTGAMDRFAEFIKLIGEYQQKVT